MTPDEVRAVVTTVLIEQEERFERREDTLLAKAVAASLAAWGVDAADPEELREIKLDRVHNRKWRKSVERVEKAGLLAAVGVVTTGILGMLWVGFKAAIGKG